MLLKIGEQYEKQEFNLQWINTILLGNLEYEVYKYLNKRPRTLNGVHIKSITLYYNADILSAVQYQLKESFDIDVLTSLNTSKKNEAKLIIDGTTLWDVSRSFRYKELL